MAVDEILSNHSTPRKHELFAFYVSARLAQVLAQTKTGETDPKIDFPGPVEASGEMSKFFEQDLMLFQTLL